MKIKLQRLESTEHGIFGHLTMPDFDCVTLERHDLVIPVGSYRISLYNSPEHGLVPLLHDVPGRSMIEIHEGNWERNSLGCILVARNRAGFAIENSKVTLHSLVEMLKGANDIWLSIC